ncbi:MAG: NAD(P)/FAD-dependent oxidoreductase [Bradymonadia bacterium]
MHIAIIGNGISGVTTAFRIRKNHPDWRISLISGESEYFFSRPALMYIYMGHMTEAQTRPYENHVWDLNRIERVQGWVTHIDTENRRLTLNSVNDTRTSIAYDKLVLAVGSQPNKFGWPGQDLEGVHGMYSLQDLYSLEANSHRIKRGVIVGGGLIGIELAEMLHARGKHVSILAREKSYWSNVLPAEESALVNHHIYEQHIDLRLETELAEILDDGHGRVCGVMTKDGERIDCEFVGLTAGVRPNLSALEGSGIPTGRGILVDWKLQTQVEGVYAVGDCAELVNPGDARNTIEQVWYTGKAQGQVAGDVISGIDRTYEQGIWFNSAKFLDLEWHTYGQVKRDLEREKNLYWEHPSRRHSMRLVFQDGIIKGVNAMGIRYRHRVCERWIAEERDAEYVFAHMRDANFDPEFYRKHERNIVGTFMEQVR